MAHPTWTIGDVRVTAFVEQDIPTPFSVLLPEATASVVAAEPWLHPHWVRDDTTMRLRIQALGIESDGRRIVVDTCVGNDKDRAGLDLFTNLQTDFLRTLTGAGFGPETVDTVVCTHLHVDHVGWNTRLVDDQWLPTFPNARYLFAAVEHHHWSAVSDGDDPDAAAYRDSVAPVFEAGLVDLFDPPHTLTDQVSLRPTVGHTPGHCSVFIESGGERAVITGDLAHHPIQFARPELGASADVDRVRAAQTRRAFVADVCDTDTLVIGSHFHEPSGGQLVRIGDRVEFRPVANEVQTPG